MIIYGWGQFNRRDHSVVRGGCEKCGRRGYQRSYTASSFFTLYFIPIIPLGRQKIICECPHCKHALGLPYRKWTRARATDLPHAIAEYEKSPSDEAAAKLALGAIFNLQDRPSLRRVGPRIRAAFARNADMLALLAGTYSFLCLDRDADAIYLEAVGLSDDPGIAAEANAHIELQKEVPPAPPNRLLQSLPVLIAPLALLFAAATYVQNALVSPPEHAFVVSGVGKPYTVLINGSRVTLRPFEHSRSRLLVYGRNEIAPAGEGGFVPGQTFTLDVPWHRRFSGGPMIVVNPDEAAVLVWERTGYAAGTVPDDAYQATLAAGRVCHTYDAIDFPFREFPRSIRMEASAGLVYRTRLSELGAMDPGQAVGMLLSRQMTHEAQVHLRARLRADDGGAAVIFLASGILPRDEFLSLAQERLATRPVQVEWHRAYQSLVEDTPDGAGLEARYRGYVAERPDDSTLTYLLSRIVNDPDECVSILARAASLPRPTPYASYGLALRSAIDGDFARAREHCERALVLDPQNEQFRELRRSVLYGLGDIETLEGETGDFLASDAPDIGGFSEHVYRLGRMGRPATARRRIPQFLDHVHRLSPMSAAERRGAEVLFEATLALAARDRAAFVDAVGKGEEPVWGFQRALVSGDLDAAMAIEGDHAGTADLSGHITLYVLLARAGREQDAVRQLDNVLARLDRGPASYRRVAGWLRGDAPPDPRLAAHAWFDLDSQPLLLAALAARFPARAEEYLSRAAAMTSKDTCYSLALASVLPARDR